MSEYLEFKILENKPKTVVVGVYSKRDRNLLGTVKWYPSWRQYTFFPESYTLWSAGCLEDIINYIRELK